MRFRESHGYPQTIAAPGQKLLRVAAGCKSSFRFVPGTNEGHTGPVSTRIFNSCSQQSWLVPRVSPISSMVEVGVRGDVRAMNSTKCQVRKPAFKFGRTELRECPSRTKPANKSIVIQDRGTILKRSGKKCFVVWVLGGCPPDIILRGGGHKVVAMPRVCVYVYIPK